MLTDRDIDYNTPMHLAVDAGSSGIVQLCIEKGRFIKLFKVLESLKILVPKFSMGFGSPFCKNTAILMDFEYPSIRQQRERLS